MKNLKKILENRKLVREKIPLIHAITNPIAINMMANSILFQGAKAICAECEDEMEEIVKILIRFLLILEILQILD